MCEVTQGLTYRPDMHEGLVGKRHEVFNRPAMCKGMWSPLRLSVCEGIRGLLTGLVCVKSLCAQPVCRVQILCTSLLVCV